MDGDPTPALTGRRRTRPTSIGCRNPWQPKPGRAPLIAAQAAVQTNRATSDRQLHWWLKKVIVTIRVGGLFVAVVPPLVVRLSRGPWGQGCTKAANEVEDAVELIQVAALGIFS